MSRGSRLPDWRWNGEGIGLVSGLLVQFRSIHHNLLYCPPTLSQFPLALSFTFVVLVGAS